MKDFEYTAPQMLREAVKLLAEKGENARVLAGGTDLIVQMRGHRFQPERVVDVKKIAELNELARDSGGRIGLAAEAVECVEFVSEPFERGECGIPKRDLALLFACACIGRGIALKLCSELALLLAKWFMRFELFMGGLRWRCLRLRCLRPLPPPLLIPLLRVLLGRLPL